MYVYNDGPVIARGMETGAADIVSKRISTERIVENIVGKRRERISRHDRRVHVVFAIRVQSAYDLIVRVRTHN